MTQSCKQFKNSHDSPEIEASDCAGLIGSQVNRIGYMAVRATIAQCMCGLHNKHTDLLIHIVCSFFVAQDFVLTE